VVLRTLGNEDAEIAEVLEVSDGTARGWVSRGRRIERRGETR
jgi:DNA-directed RNA polymerase specialized sigma24 family protein